MSRILSAVVVVTALAVVLARPAGGTQEARDGTLQALLNEVRLLRLAIEHQGAMTAGGQLLVSLLGQCNQRLARVRSEAERTEAALARQAQELGDTRISLEHDQQQLEAETDSEARADRERGVLRLRKRAAQQANAEADLQLRRTRLVEQADGEAAACAALEAQVEQLQRELEHPAR
jgi:predicted  nucleic acid-binding Zn-ribbon protein